MSDLSLNLGDSRETVWVLRIPATTKGGKAMTNRTGFFIDCMGWLAVTGIVVSVLCIAEFSGLRELVCEMFRRKP